tara:strand:+ start:323 stop:568 length:246 start_codon:yes stop_codon:yes gene_type:complete
MGSIKRKMQRKKNQKALKQSKKNLKKALAATMGMPTNCTECNAEFDPIEDADTWRVAVFDSVVKLSCPTCFEEQTKQSKEE